MVGPYYWGHIKTPCLLREYNPEADLKGDRKDITEGKRGGKLQKVYKLHDLAMKKNLWDHKVKTICPSIHPSIHSIASGWELSISRYFPSTSIYLPIHLSNYLSARSIKKVNQESYGRERIYRLLIYVTRMFHSTHLFRFIHLLH